MNTKILLICSMVVVSIFNIDAVSAQSEQIFKLIEAGEIDELETELKSGIDTEATNQSGDTAILVAARNGNLDAIRLFVDFGANINAQDPKKRDVLNIAITTRNNELAKLALELGADPTAVTSVYDGGAIIYGSAKGAVQIVDMLIKAGARINHINNLGWSALLEVAILGDGSADYIHIAKSLIAAGADKTQKDRDGRTAFDHAESRGHQQLANILQF